MIKRLLKNASFKNAGWLVSGRMGQMIISLLVGLLTARYLGPSNYGLINYATAYTSFFMSFCTLGINSVLVKEFIDHPGEEGEIIGSTLLLRAVSSFLSAGAIIGLVSVVDAGEPTTIAVTALCSIGLIFNIFETFHYWFQSQLRSKVTAMVLLVGHASMSLYKLVLLALQKSVVWFAFATALDYIVVGILLLICYQRSGGGRLSFAWTTARRLLSQSVHFILPGVMVAVYGYVDKFMLKQMLSEADVGYYATATALCGMWSFVLAAIVDSMNPTIMSSYKMDLQLFEKKNRCLYAIIFYCAVAVSLIFCLAGKWIVLLLYGKAYLPAVAPLRVITWYTAFSYLGVARNAWIVCTGKQRYLKYIYVPSAVSNVLLNLVCIPLWGATGAAAASLATQILTTMVVPFLIPELRRNSILMVEGILFRGIR
ncbi:MAG: flippase [Clostridia bacterium]|nr:flippase [Clostridia bacterium]